MPWEYSCSRQRLYAMSSLLSVRFLFGGETPWSPLDWTASDDRVRGGSSTSTLTCNPRSPIAVFHGNLDTKTLGGAGFASQRTTGEGRDWDLSKYDGLVINVAKSDEKRYTLTVKDELLPKSPKGREQSTVSWEYDFKSDEGGGEIVMPWSEFKPTYRGREKKDAEPLDLKHVKRFGLLMRSFFDQQQGDFSLSVRSISAFENVGSRTYEPYRDDPAMQEASAVASEKSDNDRNSLWPRWFGWLFGFCSAA